MDAINGLGGASFASSYKEDPESASPSKIDGCLSRGASEALRLPEASGDVPAWKEEDSGEKWLVKAEVSSMPSVPWYSMLSWSAP